MLANEQRLRAKKDFDRLWKHGRSAYGRSLGIRFAPNNEKSCRAGIVISTKVSKRSNVRNLIRRRIRDVLRNELLPKVVGRYDISVLVQPAAKSLDFAGIGDELRYCFIKAKLIPNA